jgi:Uma2 family endonuclease
MTITPTRSSVQDFEAFLSQQADGEKRFELIDGDIVEKMVTQEHGYIAFKLSLALGKYLETQPIGRVYIEARYKMPDDGSNSRIPDLSYVTLDKPIVRRGAAPYMPDLAVEIKSPDDGVKALRDKARYYLANGSRLVWLIYPTLQIVETYSADDEQILGAAAAHVLTGGDVLPDFALPLVRLFAGS